MSTSNRVIIIGGGIVGLSTAWALHERGVKSLILDRDRLGDGASYGNAGLIVFGHAPVNRPGMARQGARMLLDRRSPLYIKPRPSLDLLKWLWNFNRFCTPAHLEQSMEVLAALGWKSRETFEHILGHTDIDCDWRCLGWIDVCTSSKDLDEAEEEIDLVSPYGFTARRLEGDAFHHAHPGFTEDVLGAIHYDDSATLCPRSFSLGLRDALRNREIEIREETTVSSILSSSGKITGVRLDDGEEITSDQVILAAGTWSTELARNLHLQIPMQPARGYHRDLRGIPSIPEVGGVIRGTSIAFTPMFDRLRLAGTLEIAGYDQPWIKDRLTALIDGATRTIQGIDQAELVAEWAGYRPCTHDGLPVIGRVPNQAGLIVATGHAMMGMTLGPSTGELVAEMVCGETPSIDVSMLAADRFNR
ncbi:MAG: FAD-dependent oxidoreductase [Phycisphaerales bacterium]|nr:FAD-dependent oxidoreductase [Phycisphaerales bacterium]